MPSENFIKNITSKNNSLSNTTLKNLIKSANIEYFKLLCEKSDFIFPFLKEKINKNFVKLIEENDLKTVFEFSKVYSCDFEEMVVFSWIKFAKEDLTDQILELFENGTNEQKAYAAKYFSYINDFCALEYLNKFAFSDFEPLKLNCAMALSKFSDKTAYNKAKDIIKTSSDDFEVLGAYSFMAAYGGDEAVRFIVENYKNSSFRDNIIVSLFDFYDYDKLTKVLSENEIIEVFSVLIQNYPENINLNTIIYYQIYDYIKLISNYNNQFANNVLFIAKIKFDEYSSSDIYSFDLDKDTKNELKNIANFLDDLNLSFENILDEFEKDNIRKSLALDVIKELKMDDTLEFLAELINNNKLPLDLCAKAAIILKEFNKTSLIDKEAIDKIQNENTKALIESLLV